MPKRYGTPFPPKARQSLLPRLHLPKGRGAWSVSLHRGGTWARIILVVGLLAVVGTTFTAILTPPARAHLDVQGVPIVMGGVTLERPAGWALAAETADLTRPVVIFAPQADSTMPPVTITLYAVDVTEQYTATLAAVGDTAPSDYDLLATLVGNYAKEAGIPVPTMTRSTYNTSVDSSIVRISLVADWPTPFAWRPAGAATPATSASPTAVASPTGAPTPSPSATVRPMTYPQMGEAVVGTDMVIVSAFYLPEGTFFVGTTQKGDLFRKLVVVTLSYPADLDPAVASEARLSFDRMASNISFD